MMAYCGGRVVKEYKISLGKNPVGNKQYEGDGRTPEGTYYIDGRNDKSQCYKNLGISYPAEADIQRAKKIGEPTGGDIKIHGMLNGYGFIGKFHRWQDWTNGCIAVTDDEIDELYVHTQTGTPIEIKP